jgi:transcriptional regulator GlxA family with amidase domain
MSSIVAMRRIGTLRSIRTSHGVSRKIGLLAIEGVQLLDVSGPLDVFAEANVQAGAEVYRMNVVACGAGRCVPRRASPAAGHRDRGRSCRRQPRFHTLLVAGHRMRLTRAGTAGA